MPFSFVQVLTGKHGQKNCFQIHSGASRQGMMLRLLKFIAVPVLIACPTPVPVYSGQGKGL
jgi:hypothetical protein